MRNYFLTKAVSLQCWYIGINHFGKSILIHLSAEKRLLACNAIWIYYKGSSYIGFIIVSFAEKDMWYVEWTAYSRTSEFRLTLLVTWCWCSVSIEATQIGKFDDIPAVTWLRVNDESSLNHWSFLLQWPVLFALC